MLLTARRAAIWNKIRPEDQSEVRFGGFGDLAPCAVSDLLQTDFSWILVVSGEALERFGIAEVVILHHTFVKNCFEQL